MLPDKEHFFMIKLTISQSEQLKEAVTDYLSNVSEYDYSYKPAVLQRLYEELFNNTVNGMTPEQVQQQIRLYEALKSTGKATPVDLATLKTLKSGDSIGNRDIRFSASQVLSFFNPEVYVEASYRKVNRELSKLVSNDRKIFNDGVINNALIKIGDCYGISDKDLRPILALLCQIKLRINAFKKVGDIRKIKSYNDFGIMPAFYGPQGCGKSEFASLIASVVGSECEHGIDDIIGTYGTLDVFFKPLIVMNEFGRQKKEGLDLLKQFVNGEKVDIHRKYREPVGGRVFSSFILTSNFDPEMLKGSELGSRRIIVVNFGNNVPKLSKDEIKQAIQDIWDNCDETTFSKFFGISKEDLSRGNLEEQTDGAIEEFLGTLTDEDKEWLMDRHTITAIYKYLTEQKYSWPKTFIQSLCNNVKVFTLGNDRGRNKRYKLNVFKDEN